MNRLMRLRASTHLRDMCSETDFTTSHLIQPLFAVEGIDAHQPIPGLRGTLRQTPDEILAQVEADLEAGVRQFLLFPVPGSKGTSGFDHAFAAGTIQGITSRFGSDLHLWVDTCLCSYTEHGHCGVLYDDGRVNLEATLAELAGAAKAYAEAGAQGISPSDMMDGRTAAIRAALDGAGLDTVPIMSYSTKFASNFYGPFRHAADSAPQFGDRKAYQIDVRNRSDALAASVRCAAEGADLLMIKPGMTAIDLVQPIREATGKPVGAYQVSGEYAGLALQAKADLLDFEAALLETWHVFRRAGCSYIITYGARYAREVGVPVR